MKKLTAYSLNYDMIFLEMRKNMLPKYKYTEEIDY